MKNIKYTNNRNYRDFSLEEEFISTKRPLLLKKKPNLFQRIKKAVAIVVKG